MIVSLPHGTVEGRAGNNGRNPVGTRARARRARLTARDNGLHKRPVKDAQGSGEVQKPEKDRKPLSADRNPWGKSSTKITLRSNGSCARIPTHSPGTARWCPQHPSVHRHISRRDMATPSIPAVPFFLSRYAVNRSIRYGSG